MNAKDKRNIKCIIHYCEATASDIECFWMILVNILQMIITKERSLKTRDNEVVWTYCQPY